MPPEFVDPVPEEQVILRIDAASLRKAERLILSCEFCNSAGAQLAFVTVLDGLTGSDPTITDYVLEAPARCPHCHRNIVENTLIEAA
jgi:hypothetical protein